MIEYEVFRAVDQELSESGSQDLDSGWNYRFMIFDIWILLMMLENKLG